MEDEDDGDNNKDKKRSCKSEELGGLDTNCNSRKNSTRRDVTYGKKGQHFKKLNMCMYTVDVLIQVP